MESWNSILALHLEPRSVQFGFGRSFIEESFWARMLGRPGIMLGYRFII